MLFTTAGIAASRTVYKKTNKIRLIALKKRKHWGFTLEKPSTHQNRTCQRRLNRKRLRELIDFDVCTEKTRRVKKISYHSYKYNFQGQKNWKYIQNYRRDTISVWLHFYQFLNGFKTRIWKLTEYPYWIIMCEPI